MRVVIAFFGLCAPYALISYVSAFPHFFKRLDRFAKLATSSLQKFTRAHCLLILLSEQTLFGSNFPGAAHTWSNVAGHGDPTEWCAPEVFPTEEAAMRYYKTAIRPALARLMAHASR